LTSGFRGAPVFWVSSRASLKLRMVLISYSNYDVWML
jgi:hypothetical protein